MKTVDVEHDARSHSQTISRVAESEEGDWSYHLEGEKSEAKEEAVGSLCIKGIGHYNKRKWVVCTRGRQGLGVFQLTGSSL